MWFSLFKVVFLLSCLLVILSSSAYEVVFLFYNVFFLCLWGCLPFRWSFLPLRTSSCEVFTGNCLHYPQVVGWVKNPKIISDHFLALSANLEQLWFLQLTIFCSPQVVEEGTYKILKVISVKKSGNSFRPICSPFQPIWDNFDFFPFWPKKSLGGRG